MLEGLPGWSWTPEEETWTLQYEALQKFVSHQSRIPSKEEFHQNFPVGRWVNRQRYVFGQGKLPIDRIEKLQSIPGWSWIRQPEFDLYLDLLLKFVAREGHADVPQKHLEDEKKLGVWVSNQRRRWDKLTSEQQEALSKINGWRSSAISKNEIIWAQNYEILRIFIETFDRLPKREESFRGKQIGTWLRHQQIRKKKCLISMDQIEMMEKLPYWSW
jgi:hypothetical protein